MSFSFFGSWFINSTQYVSDTYFSGIQYTLCWVKIKETQKQAKVLTQHRYPSRNIFHYKAMIQVISFDRKFWQKSDKVLIYIWSSMKETPEW